MPQTERPAARADQAGLAELAQLVRAAVAGALQGPRPLPATVAASWSSSPADPSPVAGSRNDTWLLQASHGETAKARARRTHLSFQQTGVRDADDDTSAATTRVVALVELAKRGDAEAFGQLYDHYL